MGKCGAGEEWGGKGGGWGVCGCVMCSRVSVSKVAPVCRPAARPEVT